MLQCNVHMIQIFRKLLFKNIFFKVHYYYPKSKHTGSAEIDFRSLKTQVHHQCQAKCEFILISHITV